MKNYELQFTLEEVVPKFKSPLQKKILHSVDLIRKAERLALSYDPENGYYNTFSGGKDSQCLYHIVKMSGVKHKTHMNLTSVDPPEVIRFVRTHYPDVELIKPKDSIFNIAVKRRILPTMRVRWCCEEYKETAGAGKVTLIGIRHSESARRASRNEVEINSRKFSGTLEELDEYRAAKNEKASKPHPGRPSKAKHITIVNADGERVLGCINGKESLLISPIIDWTEDDVWTFLNTLGIAHCELYDQGFNRIGCIGCPMSQPKQKMKENERWPHVKRNWIKAIKAIRRGGVSLRESTLQSGGQSNEPLPTDMFGGTSPKTSHPAQASENDCVAGHYPPQQKERINTGLWAGFSDGSSSDRLTEEQENEIAENIYDWWISGKGYKQWYAEKFMQPKLDFGNIEETNDKQSDNHESKS